MNVLVACEESQAVCTAFREKGHNAFSCDIQECSGGHPEWHIQGDVLKVLNPKDINCTLPLDNNSRFVCGIEFRTMDGKHHFINGKWDLIIAHPPCTYLTVSGNRWFNIERYGERAIQRHKDRAEAINFFMAFVNADCDKIAIENPIGVMSTEYRKSDQIIQPFQFGHPYTKQTCLWLKGLQKLAHTKILEKPKNGWVNQSFTPDGRYGGFNGKFATAKERSKTFEGIVKAMADQWG